MTTRKDRSDAIRFLSIDAVQKANSGHPGMPMGMADIAEVLWHDFLQHNPKNPHWPNRDRFILSNGHGSMLLYSLLHLTGYDLSIDDLKQFRQLHSKTPGHPEVGLTPGVETTTGPLGQGLANAVGMAIAEKHLAAVFNREGFRIVDHYTYCFVGDGDLMEGISHEVSSFAGALALGKLIVFYDDNGISIDGDVSLWFKDNTPKRFEAYGWHVIPNIDGHNSEKIREAIVKAKAIKDKPSILCLKTTIGFGSPNLAGTKETHGAALGHPEVDAVRNYLEWPHEPFHVPSEVYASWDATEAGKKQEEKWQQLFREYKKQYPKLAGEFLRRIAAKLPEGWQQYSEALYLDLYEKKESMATRKASQLCLDHYAPYLPELLGGSADLTESNCTNWKGMEVFSEETPEGRYIHYGVREFGMSAIMNGMALYGSIIPYGGTFLTFSDYARNAVRLASLMQKRVIFVYTHDSIGLGEDGPTHQPVEQLSSLRMIPNLSIWRPCDTIETAFAWHAAIERQGPTALLFSRQNLPYQERPKANLGLIARGGYILVDFAHNKHPDAILIATGSEVSLAVAAAKELQTEGIDVRVVSIPSTDVFLQQDKVYRHDVLPDYILAKIAIEAGESTFWHQFIGQEGAVIGLNRYGASAPGKDVFKEYGFTVAQVVSMTKEVIYSVANSAHKRETKRAS